MSLRFDATMKELVAPNPLDFAVAFGVRSSEPVIALNVDLSTLSAATDVALGVGNPMREVVDLNFQSGPDPGLPSRVHVYNAVLHARFDLPVRSILVLLRPKADASNLTGELAYGNDDSRVEFHYRVIRMWNEPLDAFLKGPLSVIPLATLCQLPEDKPLTEVLRDIVREIEKRLAAEASHADAMRLMTAAFILTGLRVRKDERVNLFRETRMIEELTAFDEAMQEGELRYARRTLLRQGRQRIGNPDAQTEQEINSINDLDRMDRLADAIHNVKSWNDLLAIK